jgi:hypothetical protein
MGEIRNAHGILVGMSECKKPLGILRCGWEDNIKINFPEGRCKVDAVVSSCEHSNENWVL